MAVGLFSILAIIGVSLAFVLRSKKTKIKGQEALNERAKSHIGKIAH